MNKKGMLVLLLLLLTPLTVFADYTINCSRNCATTQIVDSCGTLTPNSLNITNLTYKYYNESNALLNTSTRTSFTETPDLTNSDLELVPNTCYYTSSYLREIINGEEFNTTNVYNNWTFRLLNGSSASWSDWTCTNESIKITNDDSQANYETFNTVLNCERGEIIDYELYYYPSTDGSCTGIPFLAKIEVCDGISEIQINHPTTTADISYRVQQYDYVNDSDCILTFLNYTGGGYDDEFVPYGVGTNGGLLRYADGGTNYTCELACDGTAYALNLVREISAISGETLGLASAVAERYDFKMEELYYNWTVCDNPEYSCLQYGNAYNNSLTYSCECPPESFDYGLYCTGDSCTRTCSGSIPENFYYNYSSTYEGSISSGEPTAVVDYVATEVSSFLGDVFPQLSNLVWVFVFIIVVFVMVGFVLFLFGG